MSHSNVRVRFAPSPTGPLHIGGVRTALYNYLFAKQQGGTFILRIEDTDQTRYVKGAEEYIIESLKWCGITPDEGVGFGGDYGPYRQSDRKDMYAKFAHQLLENGTAYKAYDTSEELTAARAKAEAEKLNFKYDGKTRMSMKNSLALSKEEVDQLTADGVPYVIRLKVPQGEKVVFQDMVREEVSFESDQLDDKVLLKVDGMPTYHMANVVDDYHMKISHVIRGEEWLPSTPTHVLLYRALGWEASMPVFSHLPLILKPVGKGKLSKRDGAKFGIPVFPMDWRDPATGELAKGFREWGFLPEAAINFLALLGWSPTDEQEIFTLDELVRAFDANNINKSGARYNFDKATWFNQQYMMALPIDILAGKARMVFDKNGHQPTDEQLTKIAEMLRERVTFVPDLWEKGKFLFEDIKSFDNEKIVRKKWKPERRDKFEDMAKQLKALPSYDAASIETFVKEFMAANSLGFGDILPFLRLATSGTMKGPAVFDIMELLGAEIVDNRLHSAYDKFDAIKTPV